MAKNIKPRASQDRRQHEGEPPRGWKERRRSTERRLLQVEEHEVSDSEWEMYFGSAPTKAADSMSASAADTREETAAEILGNVRD